MIQTTTYIEGLRWRLSLIIIERCGEGRMAADALSEVGCRGAELARAMDVIGRCEMNVGATYSNRSRRNTIMIIGQGESRAQTINTIFHETHHLTSHICSTDNISDEEQMSDVSGEIGAAVYDMLRECGIA